MNDQTLNTRPELDSSAAKPKKARRFFYVFPFVLIAVTVVLASAYLLILKPLIEKPMGETLEKEVKPYRQTVEAYYELKQTGESQDVSNQISFPKHLEEPPLFVEPTPVPGENRPKPVCNQPESMIFLLVGVDSGGSYDYQAGLADAIRLIRFDFVNKQINMMALPRDMMVDFPEGRSTMPSPLKINQTYLMGTEAFNRYLGTGNGAHSLAEAIEYNFGVSVDHYMAVNFQLVQSAIDAVGGIDVNLPGGVDGGALGQFYAGPQHLNGEQALSLMRIRLKYTDAFRVGHQTIVLKALFEKMRQPEMLLKIPGLVGDFRKNVLTDLSLEELVRLGECTLKEFEVSQIKDKQFTEEEIQAGREYIPSMDMYLFVYKWDDKAVKYIHDALLGQ